MVILIPSEFQIQALKHWAFRSFVLTTLSHYMCLDAKRKFYFPLNYSLK